MFNKSTRIHPRQDAVQPDTVGIRKQENTVRLLRFVQVLHDERYVAFLQHLAVFVVAGHSERSILSEKVLVAVCAKSVVVPLSFSSSKIREKSIFFYFFRDRDKRHFGTFGTFGGEHLLGDGGRILLYAAVSGLGTEVDAGPSEQVEEAAVGYTRALGTEEAGVLGVALSGA